MLQVTDRELGCLLKDSEEEGSVVIVRVDVFRATEF